MAIDLVVRATPGDAQRLIDAFPTDRFYVPPLEAVQAELRRSRGGLFNVVDLDSGLKADIYIAGDEDPSRAQAAYEELVSPDEGVRLAALRYLTSTGERADPRLLHLLDDDVDRVRRAAIQLLGASCTSEPSVRARLEEIATQPKRDLAERTLAKQALEAANSR